MRVIAGAMHLMGKGVEQPPGQRVALRMVKFDGSYPVVGFRSDMPFADLSKHMIGLVKLLQWRI
jgi:hypothetical protein